MDIYQSIEAEKRVGDDKISAKYSKHLKDNEQKERFSKSKSNNKERKLKITKGKSTDKGEWDILNIDKVKDEEVKTEIKSPYKAYDAKTIFEDFDYIDIKKLGGSAKKSSSKKKSKKIKKGGSVKKPSSKKKSKKIKKGGSVKKSSSKKKSKKSSSRKKGGCCTNNN